MLLARKKGPSPSARISIACGAPGTKEGPLSLSSMSIACGAPGTEQGVKAKETRLHAELDRDILLARARVHGQHPLARMQHVVLQRRRV